MIEQSVCNRGEFFPIMPFADGILDPSQCFGKTDSLIHELEQILQLFHFLNLVMQVISVQPRWNGQFDREPMRKSHGVQRSTRTFQGFVPILEGSCQASTDSLALCAHCHQRRPATHVLH